MKFGDKNERKRRDCKSINSGVGAAEPVELTSYFHESDCHHNMPAKPVTGRAAIQQSITGFIKPWTQMNWEILTLIGEGNVLVCERIDRT